MTKFIFYFIFSFSFIISFAKTIKIENPIYIVNSLIDSLDEDEMEKTCNYYNMNELPSENGFKIFEYSDGIEFHMKMDSVSPNLQSPVIKVRSKQSKSKIEKALVNSGYIKAGKEYYKGNKHAKSKIVCTFDSPSSITYRRIYNP